MARGTHKVASGETLFSIARQYYGDSSAAKYISQANGGVENVHTGSIIKLPKVTAVGEQGVEFAFDVGGRSVVAPSEESARMARGGIRPDKRMALGGSLPLIKPSQTTGVNLYTDTGGSSTTASSVKPVTTVPVKPPPIVKPAAVTNTQQTVIKDTGTGNATAGIVAGIEAGQKTPEKAQITTPTQEFLTDVAQGAGQIAQSAGNTLGNLWNTIVDSFSPIPAMLGQAVQTTAQQTGYLLNQIGNPWYEGPQMGDNMPEYADYFPESPATGTFTQSTVDALMQQNVGTTGGGGNVWKPSQGSIYGYTDTGGYTPVNENATPLPYPTPKELVNNNVSGTFSRTSINAWKEYYSKPYGTNERVDQYVQTYTPMYLDSLNDMMTGGAVLHHIPDAVWNDPSWPYTIDQLLAAGYEFVNGQSYLEYNPNTDGYGISDGSGTTIGYSSGGGGSWGGGGGGNKYYANGGGSYTPKLNLLVSWRGVGFG